MQKDCRVLWEFFLKAFTLKIDKEVEKYLSIFRRGFEDVNYTDVGQVRTWY
jgi:hypothetical protein